MASFVIHNIAAERFLELLEQNYNVKLTEEQKKEFLMANLIPDSSRLKKLSKDAPKEERKKHQELVQKEKIATHFRGEEDRDLCIQSPIVESFEQKYSKLFGKSMSYLGYLFHLYTDYKFFSELFPNTFETLDENLQPTVYVSDTKNMRVKKNGNLYTINEFWDNKSPLSIYSDYTVMNKKLLEHYGCIFDIESLEQYIPDFKNPGIEEVDFSNIGQVLRKTAAFIKESYDSENSTLNIFDENQVIDFIESTATSFFETYEGSLPQPQNKQYIKQ